MIALGLVPFPFHLPPPFSTSLCWISIVFLVAPTRGTLPFADCLPRNPRPPFRTRSPLMFSQLGLPPQAPLLSFLLGRRWTGRISCRREMKQSCIPAPRLLPSPAVRPTCWREGEKNFIFCPRHSRTFREGSSAPVPTFYDFLIISSRLLLST